MYIWISLELDRVNVLHCNWVRLVYIRTSLELGRVNVLHCNWVRLVYRRISWMIVQATISSTLSAFIAAVIWSDDSFNVVHVRVLFDAIQFNSTQFNSIRFNSFIVAIMIQKRTWNKYGNDAVRRWLRVIYILLNIFIYYYLDTKICL